jgi:hypothetical protein
MVKLAGLLIFATLALAAGSSSDNQHGTRVNTAQTTYLFQPVEIPAPENVTVFRPDDDQDVIMERLRQLTKSGQLSDRVPVAVMLNGRTLTVIPPRSPVPSAVFETWVEHLPVDYQESIASGFYGVIRDDNKLTAQRFVRDNFRHVYAKYQVTLEMLPEAGKYRVTFGDYPVGADVRLPPSEAWKVVTPGHFPVPQIVEDGETIGLELYQEPRTEQRLVEYVHVGRLNSMLRKEAAHDSYADDAQFTFTQPRVKANGVAMELAALPETLAGPILWAYVPGYGRYILSYLPHPELSFERAGEVSMNLLTFSLGGNSFRIDCADRIASGSGTYTVYARLDPSWQPADPADRTRVQMGAVPGVE